jgi:hypothetical protein
VGEGEQQVNFGPAPGTHPLTVVLQPGRSRVLWVVAGDMRGVTRPQQELARVPYGQVIFQPTSERVLLQGLTPGRYTLIWASLHADEEAPVVRTVDLPSSAEVVLTP